MAKDLSTLTPEQLMELARNPIKNKKDSNLSPVKEFIVSEDLRDGETQISPMVIYDRYTKWCKNNSIKALTVSKFFTEFKFYFNKKRSMVGMYYLLNPEGFDTSPEHQKILASAYRKRISSGKDKKTKEKVSKEKQETSTIQTKK